MKWHHTQKLVLIVILTKAIILKFYQLKFWRKYIPKPSDSNRHVSSTPKSRHQDKKFAVLSRAKKEPEGALALHGIFFKGRFWKTKKSHSGGILEKSSQRHITCTLRMSTKCSGTKLLLINRLVKNYRKWSEMQRKLSCH